MDIRQLHYFKEIVKQGSLSKAAEVLHMAQPPLSQLLKKLEQELGTTLIRRYRSKWKLTETGELLYHYANQTLFQMQTIKRQIQEIEMGMGGTVHIGVSSACSNILFDYVSQFRKTHPHVLLTILTGNSEDLLNKLEQREIDLAIVLRPSNSEAYTMKRLKKQPSVVIIPASWSAKFPSQDATLEQIAQYPFIMLGAMEGHSFYESILQAFKEFHLEPNVIIECKDIAMTVSLVSRELGLSIIPKMDYEKPFLEHTMLLELKGYDFSVEPVIVKLNDQPLPKAASQFWRILDN